MKHDNDCSLNQFVPFMLVCASLCWAGEPDRLDNYTDWGIYRGDKKGNQFAELAQIHAANVHRLRPVWEYHSGDAGNRTSTYANPIMIDGLVYVSTPSLNAAALDAVTGEEVWFFDSSKHNEKQQVLQGRNRGLVYWEGEAGRRIFVFVKHRVYAVDARTGELITTFGNEGHIDLRNDLGIDPRKASIECTSPGIVYQDWLIVASRVPEGYISTPGHIRAYDAVTGQFRWIFHTIPKPGEFGYDTWEFVEGEIYGGANAWGGFTVDEKRGWVFCATGSPSYDFYGGFRKGQNLFGNCVLALDATTGERIWHYQTVHHDIWDMDNPSAPVLVTLKHDGQTRDAVVQFTKMGLTFVLDRDTGEPLFPTPELPVPASTIPGEEAWPTQPFPLRPPPLSRLAVTEANLTRISPEAYAKAKSAYDRYATGYLYTPPSLRGNILTPGTLGGVEWHGGAFDPFLNTIYVNAHDSPSIFRMREVFEPIGDQPSSPVQRGALLYQLACLGCHRANLKGRLLPLPLVPSLLTSEKTDGEMKNGILNGQGLMPAFSFFSDREVNALIAYIRSEPGDRVKIDTTNARVRYLRDGYERFSGLNGEPALAPPWGTLNAIDLVKGEILWRVPLGEYPELVAKGIRNTGTLSFGGAVATAGGLIFIAATPDEKIRAFEKHSGRLLWEYKLPTAGYATPSTYMIDGRQYVVISAGGGGKNGTKSGDSVIAFALPDSDAPSHPHRIGRAAQERWVELFDGRTLDGWVHLNGSHTYTVEDGAIVGRTVAGSVNSFLCTTREFGDFELELEVYVDDVTNSGIQFRSQARPITSGKGWSYTAGRVYGPQVEIRRNLGKGIPTTGVFYGEALGTGWLSDKETIEKGHDFHEAEGWNLLRLVAEGPRMRSWLNGNLIDDITRKDVYATHAKGFIGLQVHGIKGQGPFVMKFRKIRIKEL